MRRIFTLALKRCLDLVLGLVALVATTPAILLAIIFIALESGRPVFFVQERAGRGGRPIRITKMRTLYNHDLEPGQVGQVSLDHELVTRVGRWLRRTKIDELPQLAGVVKGNLSLVGPRPTLIDQAIQYNEFERRRLELRPGLTGWAQVNGNTLLPWSTRIALDVWYVDHLSISLDLKILARTIATIVRGEHPNPEAIEEALVHATRIGGNR